MKKSMVIMMAVLSLFAAAVPVLAEEGHEHGMAHKSMDEKCAKECAMLLKNCDLEVDSLQQRIQRIKTEINDKGANTYTLEELKTLNAKLKETNETLRSLQKAGH